ncbi:MAG: Eco57I restriction-modification methylase domain-containing protein [Deltaproteobacteria bacterium]|nr:Eco57I restriction-modification methylase domain-containing protein [Deltaproteobacteria bacterium]
MKLAVVPPVKSLSKAYLKQCLKREQIELFKANLARMFERIRSDEHEEHLKNIVSDFLKDTWYKQTNEINTSGRADLAIHNRMTSASSVGVLIEVKRPANKNEMISPERPNAKALHELLHYYMQERYIKDNKEIRHLIVCNIHEWYIFDAVDFERFFFHNQKLVKSYKEWNDGLLVSTNTDWFYQEIAKPFIEKELDELPCTYFDLRDYVGAIPCVRPPLVENCSSGGDFEKGDHKDAPLQKRLIALYKILSPTHLLKQSFSNDSNSLNREFYSELLHIIGLEEVKDKGKKLIRRKPEGSRNDGSLLENTINVLNVRHRLPPLPEGEGRGERVFDVALELCITWLNRLLFLKLLEGQLIGYHKGDRSHAFLNSSRIEDFDELNELFFEVLAVRVDERSESVRAKFGNIPYLNSSLFEESDLERATMRINELKNRLDLPLHGSTVLKAANGKRLTGSKSTLGYLFEFLDAYDFGAEGSADIQEQNKSIINASVLGLIFEKINGYKDGSFFTPGFITMYICRETIRRAVLRRFNETYGWDCANITELHNDLYRRRIPLNEANTLVNSLKICDPAVGSGHFLVSALNEIIAVKSELRILADSDGKLLRCDVTIENDELIVTVDDQIFEYNYRDSESQRVQETLFHEKETIIENCLFGVDINPKSVAICRLRLWIELLKNAYYRKSPTPLNPPLSGGRPLAPSLDKGRAGEGLQLETLPNIDINIKCGNSLISRFALAGTPNFPASSRKKQKELADKYRELVFFYKHSPSNKAEIRKQIENLKHDLENFGLPKDKDLIALRKKENEVAQLGFAFDKQGAEARQKLLAEVGVLQKRFAEKERLVYNNAFEWRFEFPEVLDEEGEFVGFDAIIGNPPYIRQEAIKEQKPAFMEMFGSFFCGTADIYTYFYKTGLNLLKPGSTLCYIAPNKFMRAGYGKNTRELLTTVARPLMVLDFGDLPIFDEATTYPSIVMVQNVGAIPCVRPPLGGNGKIAGRYGKGDHKDTPLHKQTFFTATFTATDQLTSFDETLAAIGFSMPVAALRNEGWTLERPDVLALMDRLRVVGKPLGAYVEGKFYYGIKTGLNEAFIIDEETKARLIAEDPKSAGIIKPWLRGRDIRKWQADWAGLYIIAIASSGNREWPWSQEASESTARPLFEQAYPAVNKHLSQWETGLRKRDDKGRFWWELRACVYWEEFYKTKLVYQEIATFQSFAYAESGLVCNNKCFLIPEKNDFFLALLNSKLLWWFIGNLTSGLVGGARAMQMPYMQQLPIPPATDAQQAPIIERVQRILEIKNNSKAGFDSAQPTTSSLSGVEGDVPQLEAEIDRLVYDLYGLTDEEMAVVEGKK